MDRVAVFVDAGYLFAQGSVALSGKKATRSGLDFDHNKAISAISELSQKVTGLPLLRIYWYDGTSTGPTAQHLSLAHMSGVKVRLGFVNTSGEQKGVDSLIVTDMINLARNRAMSDAVLLSGDEDLRVGVQQAQEFGVRIHLLGVRPSRGGQSLFLLQEADTTIEWGPDDLSPFLSVKSTLEECAREAARRRERAGNQDGRLHIDTTWWVSSERSPMKLRPPYPPSTSRPWSKQFRNQAKYHVNSTGGCSARAERGLAFNWTPSRRRDYGPISSLPAQPASQSSDSL